LALYARRTTRDPLFTKCEQDNEGGGGGHGCPFILLLRSSSDAVLSTDYHRQSTFTKLPQSGNGVKGTFELQEQQQITGAPPGAHSSSSARGSVQGWGLRQQQQQQGSDDRSSLSRHVPVSF